MRARWSAPSVADLTEIRIYIGERNREAARRVGRLVRDCARELQEHPAMGRPGRVPGTRELIIAGTPFILPYRVRAGVVEILRVLHAARRWPKRF